MLAEALRSGVRPEALYATQAGLDAAAVHLADLEPGVLVYVVPDRAMARISDLEAPPGVLAVVPAIPRSVGERLDSGGPLMLLAGVGDPGNAGTLLRSAEIFGFAGVLFGGEAVEPYNPKVVRASMGAIFRIPIAAGTATEIADLARARDFELVATADGGTPLAQFTFRRRSIVAVGNERRGVAGWPGAWDRTVAIPQRGRGGEPQRRRGRQHRRLRGLDPIGRPAPRRLKSEKTLICQVLAGLDRDAILRLSCDGDRPRQHEKEGLRSLDAH